MPVQYPHERSLYRIEYPERERPQLTLLIGIVPVIDCSEDGLRYKPPAGVTLPEVGTVVEGRVRFKRHPEDIPVRGTVVRCQAGEVAVHLSPPGIPRKLLFSEQRFLGARYPERLGGGPKGQT